MSEVEGKRAKGTRKTIVHAFSTLFLQRRQRHIRVADVVAQAGVGRSTFYEHFSGAGQVQMAALARPFALLADAAAGCGNLQTTERLLAHFWENRQRARDTLSGRAGEQALRLLAQLVEERLPGSTTLPRRLAAAQAAAAALVPVRAWLLGEAPARPEALAEALLRAGAALRKAIEQGG